MILLLQLGLGHLPLGTGLGPQKSHQSHRGLVVTRLGVPERHQSQFDLMVDWLAGGWVAACLVCWLPGWRVGWLVLACLLGWLLGWLVGWALGGILGWLVGPIISLFVPKRTPKGVTKVPQTDPENRPTGTPLGTPQSCVLVTQINENAILVVPGWAPQKSHQSLVGGGWGEIGRASCRERV